jgi:prepilin-type N-terminal cleavage/methylation domain-containing protein
MKLSSHTSLTATKTSLREVPFVTLTLRTALPVILTLSKAKGKNLRTTWQSIRNNTRGVTLIEMLVALLITALIVSSVYVAFNSGTKAWQVGDKMMLRYQNARVALDMISSEFTCAGFLWE